MLNRDAKTRILHAGVLLGPLAIVKFSGVFLGSNQAATTVDLAAIEAPEQTTTTASALTWTEQHQAAARHALELHRRPLGASPLFEQAAPEHDMVPIMPVLPTETVQLQVSVNEIYDWGSESMARIDGTMRQVGDIVAGAWRITAIDFASQTVRFEHVETGETRVRMVGSGPAAGNGARRRGAGTNATGAPSAAPRTGDPANVPVPPGDLAEIFRPPAPPG